MGTGLVNCCDASFSKANEVTLTSPVSAYRGRTGYDISAFNVFSELAGPGLCNPPNGERLSILKSVLGAKLLRLTVTHSDGTLKGALFDIDPVGLKNSKREGRDGYTYFGSEWDLNGEIVNDVVLDVEEGIVHSGRHFVVYFDVDKQSYLIRDLANGFGVFLRLDYPLVIRNNTIVNVGESFLLFKLGQKDILTMKLHNKSMNGSEW